jgi:signal transduction histidine kinase
MNDMISKILDVKAIESQKLNVELERVNVVDSFKRIKKHFAETTEKKNINIEIQVESSEKYIEADSNYMMQVLENLVSNALKFSQPGRQVYLILKEVENALRLEVKDEGPGLTKDDVSQTYRRGTIYWPGIIHCEKVRRDDEWKGLV